MSNASHVSRPVSYQDRRHLSCFELHARRAKLRNARGHEYLPRSQLHAERSELPDDARRHMFRSRLSHNCQPNLQRSELSDDAGRDLLRTPLPHIPG